MRELFGYVVREAVTNVVRHAHATTCTITVGPGTVEIVDDDLAARAAGAAARLPSAPGNGLTGLAERVRAAGGTLVAGPLAGGGFSLRATVPVPQPVPDRSPVDGGASVTEPIRVLVADDQALIRGAFATLINLESDMTVVAQVGTGDDVVPAALHQQPDVALLDVQMPGLDGLAAAAILADRVPACRVIILTTFGRPGYLRRAMEAQRRRVHGQGRAAGDTDRRDPPGAPRACGWSTRTWPRRAWPWASHR